MEEVKEKDNPNMNNTTTTKRLMKLKDNEDTKMQLSYAQRLENSTRKMQERYNQAKDNRQKICVIGLSDAPNPCGRGETMVKKVLPNGVRKPPMSNVKRTSSCVKHGCIRRNSQGYGGIKGNNGTFELSKKRDEFNEKRRLNEVYKLSYAERAEMVKRKLQQGYDQREEESRKKTCFIC